jgi:hypothetical protein
MRRSFASLKSLFSSKKKYPLARIFCLNDKSISSILARNSRRGIASSLDNASCS